MSGETHPGDISDEYQTLRRRQREQRWLRRTAIALGLLIVACMLALVLRGGMG